MPPLTVQQAFELAVHHHQAGRLAEAEALYQQILAVQPDHSEALHFLGVVAHQRGRHEVALERIRESLVLNPNNPAAHSNLGKVLSDGGELGEAATAYRRALELKPDYAEAQNNLGVTLSRQGRFDEAADAYVRALELRPNFADVHSNLGNAFKAQSRYDEAIAAYRRALEFKPDSADIYVNLGGALTETGKLEEAMAALLRALDLHRDSPEALLNLGNVLRENGQVREAVVAYRRAVEIKPDLAGAHNNLGNALKEQGQLDEAIEAYRRAVHFEPALAEAYHNLASALRERGDLDDAVAVLRRVIELKPDYADAHSNLILTALYHPAFDQYAAREERRRWQNEHAQPLRRFIKPHGNSPNPSRLLRVGYVSTDFREHPLGRSLLPLFDCRERRHFEMFVYSGVLKPDTLTEKLRQRADQWRTAIGLPDEALAEMIRRDGVDILVDLNQHTAGNRLRMFAHQPAPVQVSFGGYPASAGLDALRYRITDRFLEAEMEARNFVDGRCAVRIPPGFPSVHKEQVCLIDSFWCYDPCGSEAETNALPALENGRITFGCLNSFMKVNEPVLRLWAQVLGRVKDSRLIVLTGGGSERQRTVRFLEELGVEANRLEFVEPRPHQAYLEQYHRLDIVLDPFPFGGHMTSLDTLWMGVPVISLAGEQSVARASLSQLSNLGLSDFLAFTEDDYIRLAAELAHDVPRLVEIRRTLRSRMEASPLMDAARFTRQIEAAYRAMWRRWCAGDR